jgi:Ca2+-binding RTX toxin-like protein
MAKHQVHLSVLVKYTQSFSSGDLIRGTDINDMILGLQSADTIKGNSGSDVIQGDEDHNTMYGGEGDDIIQGGQDADYFDCGDGIDIVIDSNVSEGDDTAGNCEELLNNIVMPG